MTAETPRYVPIDAPVQETDSESQPSRNDVGQFVSLRVVLAALRRRRRLWMTVAFAGLIAGMAITTVIPAKYTATSTLVLVHNPNDDPTLDMATDVALLQTTAVAQGVISRLGLHMTSSKLTGQYDGIAESDTVLEVNLSAPTPQDAILRNNALVASFLAVRTGIFKRQNLAIVGGLQSQLGSLQKQEKFLQLQIHSSKGGSSSPLEAVFDQDVTQAYQLTQTIASDNNTLNSIVKGSQVLSYATLVTHSREKRLVVDGASGLIAGLALGMGLVATQAIVSDRVRRRDEFVAALGAPVSLSVGRIWRPRIMRVRRLRRRLKRPNQTVRRLARHVGSELASVPGHQSLAVVSIDSIDASVLAVAEAGRALAAEGKRVTLVDLSPGRLLGRLLKVGEAGTHEARIAGTSMPALVVIPPGDHQGDDEAAAARPAKLVGLSPSAATEMWRSTHFVLVLAELDPAVGAGYLDGLTTDAVVVVTTGRSSVTTLRANSEMLRVAGVTIASATLVGADRNDETLGDLDAEPRQEPHLPAETEFGSLNVKGEQ